MMTGRRPSVLAEVSAALSQANRVLIASDFDGTLCPIVSSPAHAQLAPAMLEILRKMRGRQDVVFAVLSGRPLNDLISRMPSGHVYSGNHGLEISGRGLQFEHQTAVELRPDLDSACQAISEMAAAWPGAWVEHKRLTATLHYRNADFRYHRLLRFLARRLIALHGRKFRLRAGKKALEICPRIDWDKGSALDYIRQRLGPFDKCVCIGDDRTDEAMFGANRGQINVRVGRNVPSAATLFLRNAAETPILLEHVLDVIGSAESAPEMQVDGQTAAPIRVTPILALQPR